MLLVGCKYGDDYQCHFIKGSELAEPRLENVKETLNRLQLESERDPRRRSSAINEYDKLPGIINEFDGADPGDRAEPLQGILMEDRSACMSQS